MQIILGSQSPRRMEILGYFALPFVQIASAFDEGTVAFNGDPASYAQELSLKKGQELAKKFPDKLILTADTVVFFDGKIYNKPKDEEEAFSMLRTFSGNWQHVFTAISLQQGNKIHSGVEETKILFNPLSDEQIRLYHRSNPSFDKAGAYAIQQAGSILISKIDGCYYNVMGLPVNVLRELLGKFNIDLWKHLKPGESN